HRAGTDASFIADAPAPGAARPLRVVGRVDLVVGGADADVRIGHRRRLARHQGQARAHYVAGRRNETFVFAKRVAIVIGDDGHVGGVGHDVIARRPRGG